MQTTKCLFVIGLAAALVAPARTCGARDTEAQVKAREALRQKMMELTSPAATAPQPAADKPATPATPAPAQAVAPEKKESPAPIAPALAPAPAVIGTSSPQFSPVPDAVENTNSSRAQEALRQQMAVTGRAPAVAATPKKSSQTSAFTEPASAAAPNLQIPPPALTGSKAARLAELLERYKADLITPKDYHTQRATILAEP